MALLTSEVVRLKAELGFNVLTVGAEPYISVRAIFDQVVAAYMQAGATTTSSSSVTAASQPTPVTLTLASATGFAAGDRVWVDVDGRQESATVQSVSGAAIVVQLRSAHSGTYPVTVDGGEGVVRELLRQIAVAKGELYDASGSAGAVKKVDEVEFYDSRGRSATELLKERLTFLREELGRAVGVTPLPQSAGSATCMLEAW